MNGSAGELQNIHHHLTAKIAINGSAGAATLTPSQVFGDFLNTHGVWVLSYAEWIKVIGAVWVSILIVETVVKHSKALIKKVKK